MDWTLWTKGLRSSFLWTAMAAVALIAIVGFSLTRHAERAESAVAETADPK